MMKNICSEMRSNKILLAGGIILSSEVIWYLYKKLYNLWSKPTSTCKVPRANIYKSKENITEVMFFTKDSSLCRIHFADKKTCNKDSCPVRYLRKLESYIHQSTRNLDVCMYMLTCQLLSNAIVEAHKRGVSVRIIMDQNMACIDAAQTSLFHNNGVPLRLVHNDVLMHHKFVIIDNAIIITGSTNWTMSAFFGNFDHVIVTNQHLLVQPFVVEFDRLWKTFSKS